MTQQTPPARRRWERPQLVVLVRTQAEEAVLSGCKGNHIPTSFLHHFAGCHSDIDYCTTLCRDQYAS